MRVDLTPAPELHVYLLLKLQTMFCASLDQTDRPYQYKIERRVLYDVITGGDPQV